MRLVLFVVAIFLAASNANLWNDFKKKHSKKYQSIEEEKHRSDIFSSNLRAIKEHNKRYESGDETYFLKMNQFADLKPEEFKEIYLNYKKPEINLGNVESYVLPEGSDVPEAIDWSKKGIVLDVRNQGLICGSCWAFSALGAVESQNVMKHNQKIELSEQELLDCTRSYENFGCDGGNMINAFAYMIDHGISTEENYQYKGSNQQCHNDTIVRAGVNVTAYKVVDSNEQALKEAVGTVGPISVGINGYQIMFYGGGIYDNPKCGPILDHAVLAVGYGAENGKEYWILQNSWSKLWGERGYMRLVRNKDRQCGISDDNSYPVIG